MATYKLIGQRCLRKYTAERTSPVYSASVDTQLIVNSLCDVPWTPVRVRDATMTYHTEENVVSGAGEGEEVSGLDMNVRIRDNFDAALFCADHSGGQHRAYANAAVYRYLLPTAAQGKSLTSIKLSVTSDPYNANGARIHVMTNSTGIIPTSCRTCRGEDAQGQVVADGTTASRVAVRTSQTVDGKVYWYPTNANCTLSPTNGLTLDKYLFVFVLMEDYSSVRGNWIEGCSFIRNLVEITTSTNVSGWTSGATIDLSADEEISATHSFCVANSGILPRIAMKAHTGSVTVNVRTDGNLIIEDDHSQMPLPSASPTGVAAAAALGRLFARLAEGKSIAEQAPDGGCDRPGAAFNISRLSENHVAEGTGLETATEILRLDASTLVVPFVMPTGFSPSKIRLQFVEPNLSPGAFFNVFVGPGYLLSLEEKTLQDYALYASEGELAGFERLGTISGGTSATFAIPSGLSGSRCATLVVSGSFGPDSYDLTTGGNQGTGTPLIPDIYITD